MMKKIGALVLAIMMIAVVGVAGATGELTQDTSNKDGSSISTAGVVDDTTGDANALLTTPSVGNTVTFKKDIVIFNGSSSDTVVYLPNITYKYTISAAGITAGTPVITDEYGKAAVVNDGVLSTTAGTVVSTTTATVAFSNTTGINANNTTYVTTTTNGAVAEGTASFTFDPTKYLHAGVYRYKITETINDGSATRPAAGIYNTGYNADRYLDVYVKNVTSGTTNTFAIYGFVMFDDVTNRSWNASASPLSTKEGSYAGKTDGYTANKTDGTDTVYDPSEKNVDMYYTYNLNITKTTTGDLADKTHEFPFAARITNSTITSGAKFSYKENGTASTGTYDGTTPITMTNEGVGTIGTFEGNVASSGSAIKLKDGENLYIYGIPSYGKKGNTISVNDAEATALVSEYNDTYDIYKVKIEYTDEANKTAAKTDETWDGVKAAASMANETTSATTYTGFKVDYEDPAVIAFTNIMESVSPTGYVARIAPYVLILIAGVALLIVAKKRKPAKEEE